MALADVISQLGTTIINLVSNTVQGIADYLTDNIGNIPDTGGGTTGTTTIPDPLTVGQLNTSKICGTASLSGEESLVPGEGIIQCVCSTFAVSNTNYPWVEGEFQSGLTPSAFFLSVSDTNVYVEDETVAGNTAWVNAMNTISFLPTTQLKNSYDSGLYVSNTGGSFDPVLTKRSLSDTEFSTLETTSKTIISAINELKARLDNLGI